MQDITQTLEINYDYILSRINDRYTDAVMDHYEPFGMLTLTIKKESITDMIVFLKEDEILRFEFLTSLCGIHMPDNKGNELGVIYHLHSFIHNIRLRIKSFTTIENPEFPTVTPQFLCANWMERETFDFYGIIFKGHPDLRRILNMDEMDYFPMRKEYPLQDATRADKEDKYFGR